MTPATAPAYSARMLRVSRARIGLSAFHPLLLVGGGLVLSLLAMDWIAGLSLFLLWGGWKFLSREPGPPVVATAFTHQWVQLTIAVFYAALTGRKIGPMATSDYRPMILIGLASLVAMFAGFYLTVGRHWLIRNRSAVAPRLPVEFSTIVLAYALSIGVSGGLLSFAWSHPGLTQMILVLCLARYVLLFLIVQRLATPTLRWGWIAAIAVAEVAMGFAGFFADFRQPIVVVAIALLGAQNRRRTRTYVMLCSLTVLAVAAGLLWNTIKPVIRKRYDYSQSDAGRLLDAARLADVSLGYKGEAWKYNADTTVSRIWAVYYPALAVSRVPSVVPHENGALLWVVIKHIFAPRLLFPNKPELPSDSDKVRKYSGVWVSGREARTSYAFGYAAESYVDFGIPLMFLPIFLLGAVMGLTYKFLARTIIQTELRTGAIVVIFWSLMSTFEVSWVMMVGGGITQIVVLGAAAVAVDRFLAGKRRRIRAPSDRGYSRNRVVVFPS